MLASFDPTTPLTLSLRVAFSGAPAQSAAAMRVETPWLGGAACEELFPTATSIGSQHGIRLFRCNTLLLGCAQEPFFASELAERTQSLYRRVLDATSGRHLYRIWNYVPQINSSTAGLENYRAFCQGRSLAFEASFGGEFQPQLPAASAVGCDAAQLKVIFVAGETPPVHCENPEQVPAYLYPPEHGPRAPSFARATIARDGRQTWTFISGTSAIKGHQTIAPGAFDAQLECTLDNLRLMSRKAGMGDDLGAGRMVRRQFKVYLRHADDFLAAQKQLERSLFLRTDVVTYLQAEICRAALNIEIEATIVEETA
jgi:enamine deaminase RidA (YjgF/YER057c/UK114 family)